MSAGLHQEHAVGRNVGAGAGHHFFQLGDQGGMVLGEGLELVEDGLEQRRDKDAEHQERQRGDPDARASSGAASGGRSS